MQWNIYRSNKDLKDTTPNNSSYLLALPQRHDVLEKEFQKPDEIKKVSNENKDTEQ